MKNIVKPYTPQKLMFLILLIMFLPLLVQCNQAAPAPSEENTATESASPAEEPAADAEESDAMADDMDSPAAQTAPEGAAPPPGYEGQTWADIVAEAEGQTVNWYMWGGQDNINAWVNGYVAEQLQEQYGVTLNMVPVSDIVATVNKVLGEKEAGLDTDGSGRYGVDQRRKFPHHAPRRDVVWPVGAIHPQHPVCQLG